MDQRTRMFRVLVCLAVSTTGGSALLAWLEPASPQAVAGITPERSSAQARAAVLTSAVAGRRWDGVTIVPLADSASRETLAAVALPEDVHFLVTRSGDVVANSAWPRQVALGGTRHIRIGVSATAGSAEIARGQFVGLRALLEELNRSAGQAGGGPLPVGLDGEPDDVALARTLRTLLDSPTSDS